MSKGERWRGQIPFRLNRRLVTEPLEQQGRTGEPSPSNAHPYAKILRMWGWLDHIREQGHGQGPGSFTESVREAYKHWLKKNGLNHFSAITFEYRLHRRKRVMVTVSGCCIYHRRIRGDGSKGFTLEGLVQSIDGLPPAHKNFIGEFALSRIIGHHPLRMLTGAGGASHVGEGRSAAIGGANSRYDDHAIPRGMIGSAEGEEVSVYIDPIRRAKGQMWCHMAADSVGELHDFAERIGVKRARFQNHRIPHYDLSPKRRRIAVAAGAVEVSSRQIVHMFRKGRIRTSQ